MAFLNQNETIIQFVSDHALSGQGYLYVFEAGTDTLSPLFTDANLTELQGNPIRIHATGAFDLCHVEDGVYAVELRTGPRADTVVARTEVTLRDMAPFGSAAAVRDAPALLADRLLSYEDGPGRVRLSPGEPIRTGTEGFGYVVAGPEATDHHVETAGGLKLYATPVNGVFVDRQFAPAADGTLDDTAIYQRIAGVLAAGQTLRIAGAGVRVLSDEVVFPQDTLTLIVEPGAVFRQAAGTPGLDRMMTFAGEGVTIRGGEWNGNLAGNGGAYTGRGELLGLLGDHALIEGATIRGVQDAPFACGLLIGGLHSRVVDLTTFDTGRMAVRDCGDYTEIDGLRGYDQFNINGAVGCKLIVKDDTPSGAPFNLLTYRNIFARTEASGWFTAILIDHDSAGAGGTAIIRNLRADYPNGTGPNAVKFVYCDHLDVDGLNVRHGDNGGDHTTLRLQEGVNSLRLWNTVLSGNINFDSTSACTFQLGGDSRIGVDLSVPAAIQQFPGGQMVIETGVRLENFTTAAITLDTTELSRRARYRIGALHLSGAAGVPVIVGNFAGPVLRLAAGQVRIDDPLSAVGVRTRQSHGRWIGLSDAYDAAMIQGPGQDFIVANTDFTVDGPRDVMGWERGAVLRRRSPSPGDTPYAMVCTTAGASCQTAWGGTTAYDAGDWVHNDGNVYACALAGTSAAGGGPTGTGTSIVDGGAEWAQVSAKAVFRGVAEVAS